MITKFEDTQEMKDRFVTEMRSYYYKRIQNWYFKNISKHDKDYNYLEMLNSCTILQLRSIDQFLTERDTNHIALGRCYPKDHAVIYLGSMYVGIEPDGHAHS